jgi:predicted O-methyltransferase YrrM
MKSAPPEIHQLANRTGGWLSAAEGDLLYHLARSCGVGCIVEIGAFQGKSTTYLVAGSVAGARVPVYSIDPHIHPDIQPEGSTFPLFQQQMERIGKTDLMRPIVAPAEEAAPAFDHPIELLFIDGDHEDVSVRRDWDLWFPKIVPGGWIAMHDTLRWPGPRHLAEQRILNSAGFSKTGVVDSITFGRIRLPSDPEEGRLRRGRIRLYKQACNLAVRLPMPPPLVAIGSRVLRALQR